MATVNIDIDSKFNGQGFIQAQNAVGEVSRNVSKASGVISACSAELGAAGGAAGKFGAALGKVGGLLQTALMGPLGLVTAAVTALVAVITKLISKHQEAAKAAREHAKALQDLSDSNDKLSSDNDTEEMILNSSDPSAARRSANYDKLNEQKSKLQGEIDSLKRQRDEYANSDEYRSGSTAALTKRAEMTEKIRAAEEKIRSLQIEQRKIANEEAAAEEKAAESREKMLEDAKKAADKARADAEAKGASKNEQDFAYDQALAKAQSDWEESLGAAGRAAAEKKEKADWSSRVKTGLEGAQALGDKDFIDAWKSLNADSVGDFDELKTMEDKLKSAIEENTKQSEALCEVYAKANEHMQEYMTARDAGMAAEQASDWSPTNYQTQNGAIVSRSQAQRAWRRGTVGKEQHAQQENNRRMNEELLKDANELENLQSKMEEGGGGLSPGDQQKMDFLKGRMGELQKALGQDNSSVEDNVRNQTKNLVKILERLNGKPANSCAPVNI